METAQLADLIRRARDRDPAAFDAIVETYSTRLYGYFYRLTGSRHDAEDLLQELFVRVVRTIDRYEHDGRFEAWLFRIATNLVRDRVRRIKRSGGIGHPIRSDGGESDPLDEVADDDGEAPGEAMDRSDRLDRLQRAIDQLPEAEREVILLRHFSQMPFKEVADLMGTPLGTALARGHRGLARLREIMSGDQE